MPAQILTSTPSARAVSSGGTPVTRLLVVEDEESFSDAISYLLRKEGFEVAVCATRVDRASNCSLKDLTVWSVMQSSRRLAANPA